MGINVNVKRQHKIKLVIAFLFTFVLIAIYLWDFRTVTMKIEQNRGQETLEELAMQGATITKNKIASSVAILRATARTLENEEDFQSDEAMSYLEHVVADRGTDITRIGSVNLDGNARITDGRTLNLKKKNFFEKAAGGREYVSSLVHNTLDKSSIAVSVPIYDREDNVKGVVYGVIVTEDFQLYDKYKSDISNKSQYIHIIDREGNFVSRAQNRNSIFNTDNVFAELQDVESSVPVAEIKNAVANQETFSVSLKHEKQGRYVYFAPMDINRWYVVAVLDSSLIEAGVGNFHNAVVILILKIMITLLLFGTFYYRLLIEEKKRIEKLNEDLLVKDMTFNMAVSKTGDFVFLYDPRTKALEFMNYNRNVLNIPRVVENFPKVFPEYIKDQNSYEEIYRLLDCIDKGEKEAEGEIRITKNEVETIYRVRYTTVENENTQIVRVVGALQNITKEKLQEIRLKKGAQIRAAMLYDVAGFYEINLSKDSILSDGEPVKSVHTYTEMLNGFVESRVREGDRERVIKTFSVDSLLKMFEAGLSDSTMQYTRLNEQGEEYWVECEIHMEEEIESRDVIALIVIRDINDVKMKEMKLEVQAMQDPLTKIYNRSSGIEKIKKILKQEQNSKGALILIDIDNFKGINDSMGHSVGDLVLTDIAHIITSHVYGKDVVCRLGGDEFLVFLVDIPKETVVKNVTKLSEKLNLSYEKDGVAKTITVSMGIAVAPKHGTDFQTLYEKADIALYKVKNSTKNNFRFYE